MSISKVLGINRVKEILYEYSISEYKDEIKYYVNEQSTEFPTVFGFFTNKFVVGIHNRHSHFSIAELQKFVESQETAAN